MNKKLIAILIFFSLVLSACNPMQVVKDWWTGATGSTQTPTSIQEDVSNNQDGTETDSEEPTPGVVQDGDTCTITREMVDQIKATALREAGNSISAVDLAVDDLDTYFESLGLSPGECAWDNEGAVIPDGVVAWTNWHSQQHLVAVTSILADGGYGVWETEAEVTVPRPNSGGRYLHLIGATADNQEAAPYSDACMDATTFSSLRRDGDAFDDWFEKTGWSFGEEAKAGDTLGVGVFHGDLDETQSEGEVPLGTNFWFLSDGGRADKAGRFVPTCDGVTAN